MFWEDSVPFCTSSKWWNSVWSDFEYSRICQPLLTPWWLRGHSCSHSSKNTGNIFSFVTVSSIKWGFLFYNTPYPYLFCLLFAYDVLFWLFSISVAPKHTYALIHLPQLKDTETQTCIPQFSELNRRVVGIEI